MLHKTKGNTLNYYQKQIEVYGHLHNEDFSREIIRLLHNTGEKKEYIWVVPLLTYK